jgi:hypothetical protein
MKTTISMLKYPFILFLLLATSFGCGDFNSNDGTSENSEAPQATEGLNEEQESMWEFANDEESNNMNPDADIDICRCLTEPGDSDWVQQFAIPCRNVISREIGVDNWEQVNFSTRPDLNRKFDELEKRCKGSSSIETGIDMIDQNTELIPLISTSYGYAWESIQPDAQVYTLLTFDGLVFHIIAYLMNGSTNPQDFTKVLELSGKWKGIDSTTAEGVFQDMNDIVQWKFNEDFSSLVKNKGAEFTRVSIE